MSELETRLRQYGAEMEELLQARLLASRTKAEACVKKLGEFGLTEQQTSGQRSEGAEKIAKELISCGSESGTTKPSYRASDLRSWLGRASTGAAKRSSAERDWYL